MTFSSLILICLFSLPLCFSPVSHSFSPLFSGLPSIYLSQEPAGLNARQSHACPCFFPSPPPQTRSLQQLHPSYAPPSPGFPFSVRSPNPAALSPSPCSRPPLALPLNISGAWKEPHSPRPSALVPGPRGPRPRPLAGLTPGPTAGRAPSPGPPSPSPRSRGCGTAGERRPNLTYDREPGAGAEVLLIGARRPSPARKPRGAPAASRSGSQPGPSAGSQPGAGPGRALGPPPSLPTPRPLTHDSQPTAGPEGRGGGCRARPRVPRQEALRAARRAHLAPTAGSPRRSTGYFGSQHPGAAQKQARHARPHRTPRRPGAPRLT